MRLFSSAVEDKKAAGWMEFVIDEGVSKLEHMGEPREKEVEGARDS